MIANRDRIVLQVRIHSTRLPGKLLLPLEGGTVFEHILRRLSRTQVPGGVVVATTPSTEPLIRETAEAHGVPVFVGSEEDVLGRYAGAVRKYGLRHVVRATGDNPLVSIEYIDRTLRLHRESDADLTAFPDLPYGTGVEAIRAEALLEADRSAVDPFEREHITQHLYRHGERFRFVRGTPDPPFLRPEVRLTVDTAEDYAKMRDIYEALYKGEPIPLAEVIGYLDRGFG